MSMQLRDTTLDLIRGQAWFQVSLVGNIDCQFTTTVSGDASLCPTGAATSTRCPSEVKSPMAAPASALRNNFGWLNGRTGSFVSSTVNKSLSGDMYFSSLLSPRQKAATPPP